MAPHSVLHFSDQFLYLLHLFYAKPEKEGSIAP
jgi:hypothetical protein